MNTSSNAFLANLPIIATTLAIIIAIIGLYQSIKALKAKQKMRDLLFKRSSNDPKIQELHRLVREHATISAEQLNEAKNIIESISSELSREEREFVEKGLRQDSKIGAQRYVSSLLL